MRPGAGFWRCSRKEAEKNPGDSGSPGYSVTRHGDGPGYRPLREVSGREHPGRRSVVQTPRVPESSAVSSRKKCEEIFMNSVAYKRRSPAEQVVFEPRFGRRSCCARCESATEMERSTQGARSDVSKALVTDERLPERP